MATIDDVGRRGTDHRDLTASGPGRGTWLLLAALTAGFAVLCTFLRIDISGDRRIVNPEPPSPMPRVEFAGLSGTFWIWALVIATIVVVGAMVAGFLVHWHRTGRMHNAFPLFLGLSGILAVDPIFNWSMYAAYNPEIPHLPVDWEWARISPTIEPIAWVVAAYPFFYLGPSLVAFGLYRRIFVSSGSMPSFAKKHPLLSLFGFGFAFGVVYDLIVETLLLNMGIWTYWQYVGPAVKIHNAHLPVLEVFFCALTVGICTMAIHSDDRGRSVSSRVAETITVLRGFRHREVIVGFSIIMLTFTCYIGFFAVCRITGLSSNVAHTEFGGDWPYRTTMTYDPDGIARAEGVPGPYFRGEWPR